MERTESERKASTVAHLFLRQCVIKKTKNSPLQRGELDLIFPAFSETV
jgi:hypothetical protein